MIRRTLQLGALAFAVSVLGLVATQAHPQAASAQSASVSPANGSQRTTFVISGSGFPPGAELEESYIDPDGNVWSYYESGRPLVIIVGSDGTFQVDVLPEVDFVGARPGTWTFRLCLIGTTDCWETTLQITL